MPARFLGDLRNQPHCKLPQSYFEGRDCWVDCREDDTLWISDEARIGWNNTFITQSHNSHPDKFGTLLGRKIIIESKAWITSHCILYNCRIGEGSIVAAGSVVRSQQIPAWSMVEGNPARVIKTWNRATEKWEKV